MEGLGDASARDVGWDGKCIDRISDGKPSG